MMTKVNIAILGALFVLLAACVSAPPEPVEITIVMDEYSFEPNDIELRVGQEVTIILINNGALDHEFMVGRNVDYDAALKPSGYTVDLFAVAGIHPSISGGGTLMDHSDEGDDMAGMDHGDDETMDETDEAMAINMVFQPVGSDPTVLTFTVTEGMLGEWEIGCFELEGIHYTSGMVGSLTVTN